MSRPPAGPADAAPDSDASTVDAGVGPHAVGKPEHGVSEAHAIDEAPGAGEAPGEAHAAGEAHAEQGASSGSRLRLILAFGLGIVCVIVLVIPRLYPVETYAAWCRLRYGGAPSARGVVLTVGPASAGTEGTGPGPWLALTLRNIEATPTQLNVLEPAGHEWAFEVSDEAEGALPLVGEVSDDQTLVPIHTLTLLGGQARTLVVDLSRWVELRSPAPGRVRVVASRTDLRDGHRLRSQPVWIDLPAR